MYLNNDVVEASEILWPIFLSVFLFSVLEGFDHQQIAFHSIHLSQVGQVGVQIDGIRHFPFHWLATDGRSENLCIT